MIKKRVNVTAKLTVIYRKLERDDVESQDEDEEPKRDTKVQKRTLNEVSKNRGQQTRCLRIWGFRTLSTVLTMRLSWIQPNASSRAVLIDVVGATFLIKSTWWSCRFKWKYGASPSTATQEAWRCLQTCLLSRWGLHEIPKAIHCEIIHKNRQIQRILYQHQHQLSTSQHQHLH